MIAYLYKKIGVIYDLTRLKYVRFFVPSDSDSQLFIGEKEGMLVCFLKSRYTLTVPRYLSTALKWFVIIAKEAIAYGM